jgi:hypothetical protein
MAGPLAALRGDGTFRECYNADEPEGLGERNHLAGLPPLYTFLDVLGVRLYSPRRVKIEGTNPFPWPVAVRWRGLEVTREPGGPTRIRFPDGETAEVEGEEPRVVEESE